MQTKIDKYFAHKGIKTIFNCLGNNEELVRAYVGNFRDLTDSHSLKHSNHNKMQAYFRLFNLMPRNKMTGFEALHNQEAKFKLKVQKYILDSQHSPLFKIDNNEHDKKLDYKQTLLQFVSQIENPLLYLSGGADSETVASAFLASGKKFNVVIFEWVDNTSHIINASEIFYAYRFCKNNNIIPIIKQVNVEKLWESNYFQRLAIDTQILSPQLVTYAHMVNMMSIDMPHATHVFGGEVKFKTNYVLESGENSNLVWLDKLLPGYNGQSYAASFVGGDSILVQITLAYRALFSPGTWVITDNQLPGARDTGYYTDTPSVPYEFRIPYWNLLASEGFYTVQPSAAPSAWTSIGSSPLGAAIVCGLSVSGPGYGATNYASVYFDIELRVIGETTPVQASNLTLVASSSYI